MREQVDNVVSAVPFDVLLRYAAGASFACMVFGATKVVDLAVLRWAGLAGLICSVTTLAVHTVGRMNDQLQAADKQAIRHVRELSDEVQALRSAVEYTLARLQHPSAQRRPGTLLYPVDPVWSADDDETGYPEGG